MTYDLILIPLTLLMQGATTYAHLSNKIWRAQHNSAPFELYFYLLEVLSWKTTPQKRPYFGPILLLIDPILLLIGPPWLLFFRRQFLHEKRGLEVWISWLFIIHYKLSESQKNYFSHHALTIHSKALHY